MSERGAERRRKALLASYLVPMSTAALVSVAMLTFALVPYEPYKSYGYRIIPETACPGEPVEIRSERAIEPEYADTVSEIEVSSYWREESGELISAAEVTLLDVEPSPRRTVTSPVLREAPDTPGMWRVQTVLTVRGAVAILPRNQEVMVVSDNAMRVRSGSSCNDGGRTPVTPGESE